MSNASKAQEHLTLPPLLSGLSEISARYDYFIFDVWGVLHDGLRLYPGTVPTLKALREQGKHIALLSNTPSLGKDIKADLDLMGLSPALYDFIVTAGDSTRAELETRQGQSCWLAAHMERYDSLLDDLDIAFHDHYNGVDFVLNAMGSTFEASDTWIEKALNDCLEAGLPMICANPDLVVGVGGRTHKCAGTYALYYEERGGSVTYHGKPHGPVYERVHMLFGHPDKAKIIAIGDSFHTDITGANNFGIASILNLVGIHYEETLCPKGGHMDETLVTEMLTRQSARPDYILGGLT